jgi:hypothetical protein
MLVWPAAMAAHRDAALLLMGFPGTHRRSELTALHLSDVTVHPADGLHVKIRSSKTDQKASGRCGRCRTGGTRKPARRAR